MFAEGTQESMQSVGSFFFCSEFVMMDMRKEPLEIDSGPVVTLAEVVRIGDSQYNQKKKRS